MAAPPPGACEEERCQWSRSCWEIHAVQRRIHERLRRTAGRSHQPELADPPYPYYQRRLYRHLQRMPARYLADVDLDGKAEDVRLHWRILDECADPSKRPVFHARYLKSIMVPTPAGYNSGDEELDKPCPRLMESLISLERRKAVDGNDSTSSRVVHLREIIFCTLDKHGLLSRLSALIDEVRLHVRECHLYCTADGFCLALFVVDGWETEDD